jgi:superfamily II DNA helicase RecQ
MQKLGKLASAETQIVMLTATLPPSEEDELFQRMYVERDEVDLFRAETARTNVAYRVIRVGKAAKKKEVEEMVLGIVQQKLRKHKTGKVVVYSNSVPKVKELAKKLDCHAYHHKAVGKASMLEEFAAGKKRVIVATSALGIGVDIPDIWCIIHINWPFTVLDYAQESGRAGRDGLRSEAVMIVQEGEQRAAEDKQAEVEQQLVRAYVEGIDETATCRRVVLDRYLDRREKERVVCEEGEEKCDVCRGADGEEEDEEESEEDEGGSSNEEDTDTVEAEREEARRVFEQQQQARRGPRQTLIQQRQQEFADVE